METTQQTLLFCQEEGVYNDIDDHIDINSDKSFVYMNKNCHENNTFKTSDGLCLACLAKEDLTILLPCRHELFCLKCMFRFKYCPMCRGLIQIVKIST
ncbi:hypothetical protein [Trichoplusia ni ascovirus 2c]|uniref:hypothetical protein n=1 Tax=Trichoplusia ni ascovirus 2c TaxID=328615 RepID=UPI0000E441DB|nr:hypothetical protein TNAV2c_gp003 [Trichoplusia ni ascovirus 2c]ABF70520.1 hypothetical protein [Trichoplusia ni ascovirus 2c]